MVSSPKRPATCRLPPSPVSLPPAPSSATICPGPLGTESAPAVPVMVPAPVIVLPVAGPLLPAANASASSRASGAPACALLKEPEASSYRITHPCVNRRGLPLQLLPRPPIPNQTEQRLWLINEDRLPALLNTRHQLGALASLRLYSRPVLA